MMATRFASCGVAASCVSMIALDLRGELKVTPVGSDKYRHQAPPRKS
jgi:hypothetical protein